MLVNHF